jgi:DNA polymerase-1
MTAPDWLAKAQAAAGAQPQARTNSVPGRLLLVDGDALAYTCGGADSPGQARANLINHVEQAQRASGASNTAILVTARSSHKGHRYAIARAKPYQGQRSSGRRPEQWEFLRSVLELDNVPCAPVIVTATAEADDLFAAYSLQHNPHNVVIHTQDKDMRMVPGWHLTWSDMRMVYLPDGVYEMAFNDKLYGRKWFWMQMLMGDTADNIPGLPRMTKPDGKQALCGEATAAKLLAGTTTCEEARFVVRGQYEAYYQTEQDPWAGLEAMLEQAILLWMRQDPNDLFDVCSPGNPMYGIPFDLMDRITSRLITQQ